VVVPSDRDNWNLEGAAGLTFSRKFLKGLNNRGFSKEQSTSHSPTFPSLFTGAAAPGLPEAYTWSSGME